ncbi:hypothetical protein ACJX0J_027782, partial [Zea mays]
MSKENKATSHTPLIDHHYKTYHHRQFQIQHKTGLLKSLQGAALAKAHSSKEEKRIMEATEREKKGGTKGKIVMKIMLSINKHITENSVNSV